MNDEVNRRLYETFYSPDHLRLDSATPYDRCMTETRLRRNEKWGRDKVVLDLCCGSGAFTRPLLGVAAEVVALDFSAKMLSGLDGATAPPGRRLRVIQGDARAIPLPDDSVDYVFSYSSLYHVPDVERVLGEVSRVLKPGGRAALELGNRHSLAGVVGFLMHKVHGWAKLYGTGYRAMMKMIRKAGWEVEEHRAVQILPMYGGRFLGPLYLLCAPFWKRVLGPGRDGVLRDEKISSRRPWRWLAFRHCFLLRKPCSPA